jgi:hypothetical protein
MDLYYNIYVLEPLEYELCTTMNTNALKTILLMFVYSMFLSFVASFQHKKPPKCTKLFSMMSPIHLYRNHYVVEPL